MFYNALSQSKETSCLEELEVSKFLPLGCYGTAPPSGSWHSPTLRPSPRANGSGSLAHLGSRPQPGSRPVRWPRPQPGSGSTRRPRPALPPPPSHPSDVKRELRRAVPGRPGGAPGTSSFVPSVHSDQTLMDPLLGLRQALSTARTIPQSRVPSCPDTINNERCESLRRVVCEKLIRALIKRAESGAPEAGGLASGS